MLLGNGINRHPKDDGSSWENLLKVISEKQGLNLTDKEITEMSDPERFDILDLAKPSEDRSSLQSMFCDLMAKWTHGPHHKKIMNWAMQNSIPVITTNFDENLSSSIDAKFYTRCGDDKLPGFSRWYPWRSYFGNQQLSQPDKDFAIWHAHGMRRYSNSIRLGLTHYVGSAHHARVWIYRGDNSLIRYLQGKSQTWSGRNTWLHPFFFMDIMILGLTFSKDETFLRWLFLERAKLHKRFDSKKKKAWYITKKDSNSEHRKAFFERLEVEFLTVADHPDIYESPAWG